LTTTVTSPCLQVVPDDSSHKYMARLLSQGLRLEPIEAVLASVTEAQAGDTRRFLPPCMFWAQGRCDRGVNCKFYHSPQIAQEGEAERAVERADIVAELNLSLAHAAALLGQWERATVAVQAGRKALRCERLKNKGVCGGNCMYSPACILSYGERMRGPSSQGAVPVLFGSC
jgi:hypothetical protein